MGPENDPIEDKSIEGAEEKPPVKPAGAAPSADQLKALTDQISSLSNRVNELASEKDGTLRDLQEERRLRRELESKIKQAEEQTDELGLSSLNDQEYLTGKHLKVALTGLAKVIQKSREQEFQVRMDERMADDEARMKAWTDGREDRVPWEEAFKEFQILAKADPSLKDDIFQEARRPGGKPAEKLYKIALRESAKFKDLERKRGREEIVKQIDETGKVPTLRGGGGGDKPFDPSKLTDQDISTMDDDKLDELLRKTG